MYVINSFSLFIEVDRPFVLKPIFDKLSRELHLFNDESSGNSVFPDVSSDLPQPVN